MDSFCRLCGSEEGIRVNIFESGTEHVKKIHKILPITINEHDPFPKSMCHRCSFKVNEFFEFRTNCIKAQEVFKSKVPWLREKHTPFVEEGHPPMVEVPLNPINAISPNEKERIRGTVFIDENDSTIIIEDDSPPPNGDDHLSSTLLNNCPSQDKIIMKIKRTDIKKRPKIRSMWDTKKRKRKSRKACRIAEVYTTSMCEYENIGNIENDPLRLSPVDSNDNEESYSCLAVSPKTELDSVTNDKADLDNVTLPKHILVTNIPRVGYVYTCENCGRTFLSPQPARSHTCEDFTCNQDDRSIEDEQNVSPTSIEFYNCGECGQVFSRHSQLSAHQKKHYKEDSSSDDSFTPFNSYKRKPHAKKKAKRSLLNNHSFFEEVAAAVDQRESSITKHSLLSSDSD